MRKIEVRADEVQPGDLMDWHEPGEKATRFQVRGSRPALVHTWGEWQLSGSLEATAHSAISLHGRSDMVEVWRREAA